MGASGLIFRIWGVMLLLLVASVPFFNYADQPRRLIGAAATLSAFLMIRMVWDAQDRKDKAIARQIDAIAIAIGRPRSALGDRVTSADDEARRAEMAALQATELFDRIQRDRKHRRA
jgi:hypothetical protein